MKPWSHITYIEFSLILNHVIILGFHFFYVKYPHLKYLICGGVRNYEGSQAGYDFVELVSNNNGGAGGGYYEVESSNHFFLLYILNISPISIKI